MIFVDQSERRAGDIRLAADCRDKAFHELRFAGAEIAGQREDIAALARGARIRAPAAVVSRRAIGNEHSRRGNCRSRTSDLRSQAARSASARRLRESSCAIAVAAFGIAPAGRRRATRNLRHRRSPARREQPRLRGTRRFVELESHAARRARAAADRRRGHRSGPSSRECGACSVSQRDFCDARREAQMSCRLSSRRARR